MKTTTEILSLQQVRLKEALKESGMLQKDLAKVAGYTPAWMSKISTGKVALNSREAARIGEALGVRPEWLLGEDNIKVPVRKRWLDKRYENIYRSFHLAGYDIETTDSGMLSPGVWFIPERCVFLIHTRDGSQHYRATYAEITRLLNSIEATERALVQSFARTSCPVDPAELERIREKRRAEDPGFYYGYEETERKAADLAAYNDGYEETEE